MHSFLNYFVYLRLIIKKQKIVIKRKSSIFNHINQISFIFCLSLSYIYIYLYIYRYALFLLHATLVFEATKLFKCTNHNHMSNSSPPNLKKGLLRSHKITKK